MANRSGSSSWIYSYWTYPAVPLRDSSVFPFPQRWTTWNSFRSSGRILRTLSLTEAAPRLPPITISTGLSAVKPQNLRPFSAFPERSSWRIGVPVRTALSAGRLATVSGKLQQILDAEERQSLLARPGVMSDSWINAGIFKRLAAITTGTVTKPPLEKTTSGFSSFRIFLAWLNPFSTRKGSEKFLRSK